LIYLVDASCYIFRAWYSMPIEMVDRDGQAANAVFGFARMICDLLERVRPKHIAVAFDESLMRVSFRNRLYPAYKANRERPPAALSLQFQRCREFCRRIGIPAFGSEEYEADDIIGTLACMMRREGVTSAILTRDKDLSQLIRQGDMYWDYGTRDQLGYHDMERRFGVSPERFADYLALTGDAVDNIPGVPGIGPKTAALLMKEFASLDELYGDLARILRTPKVRGPVALRARLNEHRDGVFLARQLTSIACNVPIEGGTAAVSRRLPDLDALTDFYDHHRFGPVLRNQSARLAQLPLN
jgi:DNA polymerase-1